MHGVELKCDAMSIMYTFESMHGENRSLYAHDKLFLVSSKHFVSTDLGSDPEGCSLWSPMSMR